MIETFKIGNLYLRLERSRKYFNLIRSMSFEKFISPIHDCEPLSNNDLSCKSTLIFTEMNNPLNSDSGNILVQNETWELLENEQAELIYHFKHYNHPFITVHTNRKFESAQFHFHDANPLSLGIPLMDLLEIRIYLNWLANFGDLVLHASGFVYEGKGYCFLGQPGVTILGEDQVILRYLDGQFRIFGTPWHTDPEMCSPLDAPLEKMFFLDRSQPQTIRETNTIEVTSRVLQTAFVPWYRKETLPLILERVALLSESKRSLTLSYKLGQDGLETLLAA